jgi:hypothetical protein
MHRLSSWHFITFDSPGDFASRLWLHRAQAKEKTARKRKWNESGPQSEHRKPFATLRNSMPRKQLCFQPAGESMEGIKPGIREKIDIKKRKPQKPSSLSRYSNMASLL